MALRKDGTDDGLGQVLTERDVPLPVGKTLAEAAADVLDQKFRVMDLAAKGIADEAPRRGNPVNTLTLPILRRRCYEAKEAGQANIAVDVNLLIELMNGSLHGMKNGFESRLTI